MSEQLLEFKVLNEDNVSTFRDALIPILNDRIKDLGIILESVSPVSEFNQNGFENKFYIAKSVDGKFLTYNEFLFDIYHTEYRLDKDILGKRFKLEEGDHVYDYDLLGLGMSSRYPLVCKCVQDGKEYNFTIKTLDKVVWHDNIS